MGPQTLLPELASGVRLESAEYQFGFLTGGYNWKESKEADLRASSHAMLRLLQEVECLRFGPPATAWWY